MKIKTIKIASLLLTGTLLFAGCGSSANTNTNSPAAEQSKDTAASAQSETTTAADTADSASAQTPVLANDTFAQMETTDIDGNTVDTSIFSENKITLVNVWNVGCTPCVNEIPELDKVNSEFADKGAAVIGLYNSLGAEISDDEMRQIQEILAGANATYLQLQMTGTLANADLLLNMMVFPTTYVIDSNGAILDTIEGSNDYEGWKSVIESYLSQTE